MAPGAGEDLNEHAVGCRPVASDLDLRLDSLRFGLRRHPVLKFTRLHAGVDFAAPPGTPILAAGAGRVVEAGPNGGYGKWVKISHDGGLATGYAHMSRIAPGVRQIGVARPSHETVCSPLAIGAALRRFRTTTPSALRRSIDT